MQNVFHIEMLGTLCLVPVAADQENHQVICHNTHNLNLASGRGSLSQKRATDYANRETLKTCSLWQRQRNWRNQKLAQVCRTSGPTSQCRCLSDEPKTQPATPFFPAHLTERRGDAWWGTSSFLRDVTSGWGPACGPRSDTWDLSLASCSLLCPDISPAADEDGADSSSNCQKKEN
jgi:hypothetical protein